MAHKLISVFYSCPLSCALFSLANCNGFNLPEISAYLIRQQPL